MKTLLVSLVGLFLVGCGGPQFRYQSGPITFESYEPLDETMLERHVTLARTLLTQAPYASAPWDSSQGYSFTENWPAEPVVKDFDTTFSGLVVTVYGREEVSCPQADDAFKHVRACHSNDTVAISAEHMDVLIHEMEHHIGFVNGTDSAKHIGWTENGYNAIWAGYFWFLDNTP